MLILKLELILQEILDPDWDISTLYQVLFEQLEMDSQLIYQIVVYHDIATFFLIYTSSWRIMHPFWLVLRVLNKDNKKDFSSSFLMLLMRVTENRLLIYYTMTVILHSTQNQL